MPRIVKSTKPKKRSVRPLPGPDGLKKLLSKKRDGRNLGKDRDWDRIRTAYLEAEKTPRYKDLALQFDVPQTTLQTRAGKERWGYLRAQMQQDLFAKRIDARKKQLFQAGMEFDDLAANSAKMGLGLVTGRLAQIYEEFQATQATHSAVVERLRRGEPVDRADLYTVINYKELDVLARAAIQFQDMGRKALGTDVINIHAEGSIGVNHSGTVEIEATVDVRNELSKDDPSRLAAMLEAMERAGLIAVDTTVKEEQVYEGEVVSVTSAPPAVGSEAS